MDGHTAVRGPRFDSLLRSTPLSYSGPRAYRTVQPEFFQFPRRNVRLGISLSTDLRAFSSFRSETCESTSLSALNFVPFQEQEKVWRGLIGENYNRITAKGLGGLIPRSALQLLLRLRLRRRSGLCPLQGSKQESNLQKKRKGFTLDPSDIQSFLLQRHCPET